MCIVRTFITSVLLTYVFISLSADRWQAKVNRCTGLSAKRARDLTSGNLVSQESFVPFAANSLHWTMLRYAKGALTLSTPKLSHLLQPY